MFALQKAVATVPRLTVPVRNAQKSVIGTPPLVKLTTIEKIGYFAFISAGIMALPLYILANLKTYKKGF